LGIGLWALGCGPEVAHLNKRIDSIHD
jgi:hypothetical protein